MPVSFSGLSSTVPVNSSSRATVACVPLGTRAFDTSGGEWVYVKAGATIAQFDSVRINGSVLGYDDVRPTSADDQVLFGVADAAFALAEFGFVQVRGVATSKVIVATAAGSSLAPGATAGTLKLSVAASLNTKAAVALVTGIAAGSGVILV